MTRVYLGSGSNTANTNSWTRGKLVFDYGTTNNNGNVRKQEHYVPTVVTGGESPNIPETLSNYVIPMQDGYEYDALNRITKVTGTQQQNCTAFGVPACSDTPATIYTQAFSYDAFGNRKINAAQTSGVNINNKVYEPNKRNNRLNGLVYDAAGNVINDSYTFRVNDRKYDAENRMTQANGTTAYYVYDGDGRRVRRIVNGTETWQVYGIDGELLAEYAAGTATTSPQKEYGYRGGQLLIVAEQGGSVKWLVSDHLGTPRIIVDASGSLNSVKRHDYLPFGEELTSAMAGGALRSGGNGYATDTVRQKFGSKERDNETGLDYFLARYYSSVQGRFISVDPENAGAYRIDPQSWNAYAYARNNPVVYSDPDGRAFKICYGDQKYFILSDDDAHTYIFNRSRQKDLNFHTQNDGKIYNYDGAIIGTYENLGCDCWNDWQKAVVQEVAAQSAEQTRNPLVYVSAILKARNYYRPRTFGKFGGYRSKSYKNAIEKLKEAGTHEDIDGLIPSRLEAEKLIAESGGKIKRIERGHTSGRGHEYDHINYETASGEKATIRVESVDKQWYAPGQGKFKDPE